MQATVGINSRQQPAAPVHWSTWWPVSWHQLGCCVPCSALTSTGSSALLHTLTAVTAHAGNICACSMSSEVVPGVLRGHV
jgi:hypothetical protein